MSISSSRREVGRLALVAPTSPADHSFVESVPQTRRANIAVTVLLRACGFVGLLEIRALFGYLRGISDNTSFPHERVVLPAMDRVLGLGLTPGERLQSWFFHGHTTMFDSFWLGIYDAWFLVPTVLTLYMVIFHWNLFRSYAAMRLLVYFLPLPIYFLIPTEPPWMAISGLRIQSLTTAGFPFDSNPVAAFPSMHVLTPVTIALWLAWKRIDVMAWVFWIFSGMTIFAVLYLGEHYLVDVLASLAIAPVIVLLVRAIEEKFSARRAGARELPAPAVISQEVPEPSQAAA
jgi:hypothetical protein